MEPAGYPLGLLQSARFKISLVGEKLLAVLSGRVALPATTISLSFVRQGVQNCLRLSKLLTQLFVGSPLTFCILNNPCLQADTSKGNWRFNDSSKHSTT